ncbi:MULTISPECIES: ABC transporter permease subunit [Bacillus]|uniref:ABC-2 type transport system permease protein n=1 Tax=Bacillus aerius TaxID=293388 RepID=A0ABR6AX11_9BACI|nr:MULTISPECIES: ABC transporter permease subunit [Bacillus]WOQ73657.1 ABC transporter permease subunit [Bacillus stratosphericus]AKC67928.1 ABC transporter ATP-binding protein [Bacillus altitudinis]KKK08672.1 ABC transporter ATP-binding protein [Bacillus sp. L_1B0_12]KQU13292.1 ABC transporter ATP-binding protein [Bacillus sp. Leaf49]MBA8916414.1 ABC-2 type transport system permease protein [Bacillus aerius]
MIRLIQNEWMKISYRVGTWIMVGLLVLGMIATLIFAVKTNDGDQASGDWKTELQEINKAKKQELKEDNISFYKRSLETEIAINEYRIKHDLPPADQFGKNAWTYVETNANLLQLVGVFVIIIAATIVSAEYKHGTIKLLLIRPPSRLKVLLSKYFTVQLYSLFLIAVLFILSFILGAIFFGLNNDYVYLAYQNGEVIERSQFANMVSYYLAHCAMFVVLGTLSFAISTVFRSEAISIAISVLAYVVGASITSILMFFFDWAKYLLFANDPAQYFAETPTFIEDMSLGFSLTVLVIYWAIFLAVALIVFQKREVKTG